MKEKNSVMCFFGFGRKIGIVYSSNSVCSYRVCGRPVRGFAGNRSKDVPMEFFALAAVLSRKFNMKKLSKTK
jgi:hypothetical protein